MGMFLNRGITEFEQVVHSPIYVDKTDMIDFLNKAVYTEQRYLCVSRPRRFGKSITANMIAAYYEKGKDSSFLFENRKLAKKNPTNWKKYKNQFDVIRIDVAGVRSRYESAEETMDVIERGLVKDLKSAYPMVPIDETDKVAEVLDRINQQTAASFVIIIDEWDSFFRDEKGNTKIQKRYIQFLRSLFKDNASKKFLALAYITGILPIKRYNSESALNNFYEYTMISPKQLAPFIGFTDEEVAELCKQYQMDFQEAKKWYDGYYFKNAGHLYSPNSIVQAMLGQTYENFWSQTVAYNSLLTYITMNFDGLKDDIIMMLGGERVPVKVRTFQNDMVNFRNKHDVLTVLIHLGYLAYDMEKEETWIPNQEIRLCFEDNLEETGWSEVIESIENSEELLRATLEKDEEEVAYQIDLCHSKNTSILKYNNENALSCVLTLAYYTARKDYMIIREFPSGYGFAELVFLPKKQSEKPAMIIELKWKKDAKTALTQIKEQKYLQALEGYHGKVLLVGINYEKVRRGEQPKKHTCVIEEVEI